MLKKATMGFPLLYHILMALPNASPAQEGRHHFRVATGDGEVVLEDVALDAEGRFDVALPSGAETR